MCELIALCFDEQDRADEILLAINKIEENLITPEDAAVVIRDGGGRVKAKLVVNMASVSIMHGGAWGGFWGLLLGMLFFKALLGRIEGPVVGGGTAAMAARLADSGIDDGFIRALGDAVVPNTSVLFMRVRLAKLDTVLTAARLYGGIAFRCTLVEGAEATLLRALAA